MIQFTFNKNKEGSITSFKVEGHAGYAPHGQDIVCAAVSTLVIGTINGLQELTDAPFDATVDEGIAEVEIYTPSSYSNVLVRSMVMSLEGIQEEYSEFINIYESVSDHY